MRRIVYSKNAIKFMLTLKEPQTTVIIKDLTSYLTDPNSVDVKKMPGSVKRRMVLKSQDYYALFQLKKFKGADVLYVIEVIEKGDLHYYMDD